MTKQIHELQDRRAAELEAAKSITDKAKEEERGLTDEEEAKVAEHVAASKQLASDIKAAEEKEKARLALQADLDAELADSNQAQASSVRPNPAPRKAPNPRVTGGEAAGEFGHFGDFLSSVYRAAVQPSMTDQRLAPSAAAPGMRSDLDSLGGFLIPETFSSTILERIYETGNLLSRIKRDGFYSSLEGNTIKLPADGETSRADGSRSGGIRGYWVGETDSIPDSKGKFSQIELTLNKAGAVGYVTEEMLSDSPLAGAWLKRKFEQELLFTVENSIVNGNGANKPVGLLAANCGVSTSKETNQTAATIWGPNISKMWARMWAPCRKTAVWLVSQSCEPFLDSLTLEGRYGSAATSVEGIPMYHPAGSMLNTGEFGLLKGRPVIPVEYCPTVGTVGDIILWDPASYIIVDKAGGPQMASSIHVRFLTDEQTFRITYRVDGQPTWSSALTPYNAGDTLSPIVKLAVRE